MLLSQWSITVIGLIAATCTTVAFVPQVVRVWRLQRADEISLSTFLVLSVGMLIWLAYGVLLDSLPLIFANAVTVGLTLTIVALKLKWDRAPARIDQ
ncbi:MAG: SemiSWEET transporter [Thermoplasmata archaeon]|nr:SemiSWEET transporter [Thermoplasmata archaeon]